MDSQTGVTSTVPSLFSIQGLSNKYDEYALKYDAGKAQLLELLRTRHTFEIQIAFNVAFILIACTMGSPFFITLYNLVIFYLWKTNKFRFDAFTITYFVWNNMHNYTHGFYELELSRSVVATMDDYEHGVNNLLRFAFLTSHHGLQYDNLLAFVVSEFMCFYYCWDRVWYPGRLKVFVHFFNVALITFFHFKLDRKRSNFTWAQLALLFLAVVPVQFTLLFRNPVGTFLWKNSIAGLAFMTEGLMVGLKQSGYIGNELEQDVKAKDL